MPDRFRIHVLSDLHVDHGGFHLSSAVTADVLVVAGDLAGGPAGVTAGLRAIRKQAGPSLPIIYVAGNHDWYGADIVRDRMSAVASWQEAGVTVLDPGTLAIADRDGRTYRLIACTWWSAMDWLDDGQRGDAAATVVVAQAQGLISDFRMIRHNGTAFRPYHALALHAAETAFLHQQIVAAQAASETPIVVTHYGPTRGSCHPKYGIDPLNAYFQNDRPDLTVGVPLWIHGHTHSSADYVVPETGCRVVCNPKGYEHENSEFQARLVVEV